MFNGPPPTIRVLPSEDEEIKTVGNWVAELAKSGLLPHECGIFVRSSAQLDRARSAAAEAGMPFKVLDEHVDTKSGHVLDQHHAPRQRFGISRRGSDGLR